MIKNWKKFVAALGLVLIASACTGQTEESLARSEQQAKKATGETLEKKNLEEKRKREEDPNAIGYVYKYSMTGVFTGYWVTKGKVSSNGSQATPEQDIVSDCGGTSGYYTCSQVVVDGPQDDGSYGDGDPGIFFFLADGTKVVIGDDNYIHQDRPIQGIVVPLLGGATP